MSETRQQIIDRISRTPLTPEQIHEWSEAFRCRIAAKQTSEVATLLRAFAVQAVEGRILRAGRVPVADPPQED